MLRKKREHPIEKTRLHPRNRHRSRYDFKQLIECCPDLSQFVKVNIYDDESIDFSDQQAVKILNTALLKHYYNIFNWDIPQGYLIPPIPGRADYIHHVADLLGAKNYGTIPTGTKVVCLDIGVGANCVYPIIGYREYGWTFVGCDIDPIALESATKILDSNPVLKEHVDLRLQRQPNDIFFGVIQKNESIDLTMCNPPFHASPEDARTATLRKLNNLSQEQTNIPVLNFGGQHGELWCHGGELKFIRDMVRQSKFFSASCFWFSTLVSKKAHLTGISEALANAGAFEVKTIPTGQGNKSGRIVAWTFLTREQQKSWVDSRWKESSRPA